MRVYLDEDVYPEIKARLKHAVMWRTGPMTLSCTGSQDGPAYVEAVKRGYALDNYLQRSRSREIRQRSREAPRMSQKDLPIPIYELTERGAEDRRAKLERAWPRHERQILHLGRQLEHASPEKRHREAVSNVEQA